MVSSPLRPTRSLCERLEEQLFRRRVPHRSMISPVWTKKSTFPVQSPSSPMTPDISNTFRAFPKSP